MDSIKRQIAEDLVDYLRENPEVCADVNPVHYGWVRYRNGEWQRASHGKHGRINGWTFDSEQEVLQRFIEQGVTLLPCSETYQWKPSNKTVWELADEQDVFTMLDRCTWCGYSERTKSLTIYETTDDGLQRLCEGCTESWEKGGEIVSEVDDEEAVSV